jgi:hypothetical protein
MRQIPSTLAAIALVLAAIFVAAGIGFAGSTPLPIEQFATPGASSNALFTVGPGSYYLSKNIGPTGAKSGIAFRGNNVTIDFRGYSIVGNSNTGGLGVNGGSYNQITIQNGNVLGMGGGGISVGSNSAVRGMHVTGCGGIGIQTGASSVVQGNTVTSSTADGISAAGLIDGNVSDGNGGNGITAANNSIVTGNEASANSGYGISLLQSDGYANDVVNNNTKGTINGGTPMGGSVCDGAACP